MAMVCAKPTASSQGLTFNFGKYLTKSSSMRSWISAANSTPVGPPPTCRFKPSKLTKESAECLFALSHGPQSRLHTGRHKSCRPIVDPSFTLKVIGPNDIDCTICALETNNIISLFASAAAPAAAAAAAYLVHW